MARDDYAHDDKDQDCLLLNPNWKVKPSIYFVNGIGTVVLTCSDHNKGNTSLMIHPCRQPSHILPSEFSDQLCHVVIKPRCIKPIKASQYYTSFQMHEQRSTFNSIDTCSITAYRKFYFTSYLHSELESRSIANLHDINGLLTQLTKEKVISKYADNEKRKEIKKMAENIDFDKYIYGSTFVPLEVAMSLHREREDKLISCLLDNRGDDLAERDIRFEKYWTTYIFPIQNSSSHGAMFPTVPMFNLQHRDHDESTFIWIICALLIKNETCGKSLENRV